MSGFLKPTTNTATPSKKRPPIIGVKTIHEDAKRLKTTDKQIAQIVAHKDAVEEDTVKTYAVRVKQWVSGNVYGVIKVEATSADDAIKIAEGRSIEIYEADLENYEDGDLHPQDLGEVDYEYSPELANDDGDYSF